MKKRAFLIFAMAGTLSVGAATPSFAEDGATSHSAAGSANVQPDNYCPPEAGYDVYNSYGSFVRDPSKTVYGQSGVTLSISAAKGTSWSGTVTGTVEGDVSAIVASAKASVSGAITYTKTTTVALGGSWTVPSSQQLGWLALGSQGYNMNWKYGSLDRYCHYHLQRSGTASLPALSPVIGHS